MRLLILALLPVASGCATAGGRNAKSFVEADARSDAENSALSICDGDIKLIEGRKGFSPDDYRCLPKGPQSLQDI